LKRLQFLRGSPALIHPNVSEVKYFHRSFLMTFQSNATFDFAVVQTVQDEYSERDNNSMKKWSAEGGCRRAKAP